VTKFVVFIITRGSTALLLGLESILNASILYTVNRAP
jgi:hypothetical protein